MISNNLFDSDLRNTIRNSQNYPHIVLKALCSVIRPGTVELHSPVFNHDISLFLFCFLVHEKTESADLITFIGVMSLTSNRLKISSVKDGKY